MNRASLVSLALLLSSVPAFSQNYTTPISASQPVVTMSVPQIMGASCPVGLVAQQRGTGSMVQIQNRSAIAALPLELHWNNHETKDIVGASLLVFGYDASARILPAETNAPQMRKVFNLKLDLSGNGNAITDFIAHSFAAVSSIELRSIEYADGTQWHLSSGEICRIAPDNFVLVGSR